MKNLFLTYHIVLIALLCGGCQHNNGKHQNAALALYSKYAGNDRLTVAYLGDFKVQDNAINAVMIKTDSDDDWVWLQNEFAVPDNNDLCGDTTANKKYSVDIGVQWDISTGIDDKILEKEHLSDDEIDLLAQSIVNQLNAALSAFLVAGAEVQSASIIISDDVNFLSDLQLDMQFRDETAVKRILQAVTDKLNNNGLTYNDTPVKSETVLVNSSDMTDEQQERINKIRQNQPIMQKAMDHGQNGYVTAVDNSNRTLWIFFYKNAEECTSILTHIREDIFTFRDDNIDK